jgi:hypothetical protein
LKHRANVKHLSCLLSLIVWFLPCPVALAVVDANSRSNTNAPSDGSPWASAGQVSVGGGTYLGAGWVLTATHVGPGTVNFGGSNFAWDGTTAVRLTNSTGSSNDLYMFKLKTLPPLPRMPLTTTTPAASSQVDMLGFGYISGSAETSFGPGLLGFSWSSTTVKSWGNNKVAGGTTSIDVGEGPVTCFTMDFSATSQTSDEAQASNGDSGGGVFFKSGSTWELAGMLLYISELQNQPANTSLFGDVTYAANIATYYPQIEALLTNTVPTLSISRSTANFVLSWADTGVAWTLASSHNPATTNWTVLSPSLTLTNGQYYALVPDTNSSTFFRLQR